MSDTYQGLGMYVHPDFALNLGRQEPIIDLGSSVSPSVSGNGAAIPIMDHFMACSGGAYVSGAAASSAGVELARIQYAADGRTFIWCKYAKNYYNSSYDDISPHTGSTNVGGGCGAVISCVDPITPVAALIPGVIGTNTCQSTATITTDKNQRVFILVGTNGSTVPVPPAGYMLASSVGGLVFGVHNDRAQVYASVLGAFPDAGMIVPSVTFSGSGNGYMNCVTMIMNGYNAPVGKPLIVSARVQMAGGNAHSDFVLCGAKKGDVWCSFGAADLNADAGAVYTFPEWDTGAQGAWRFGYPNEEHFNLDGDVQIVLDTNQVQGAAVAVHLLLRNVRRGYPIYNWSANTLTAAPTGTYPTFVTPVGPNSSADGLAVDIIRWTAGQMQILSDSGTDYSGTRGTGNIDRQGAFGIVHGVPILSGAHKSSRTITMRGTSQPFATGKSVTIIGRDNTSILSSLKRTPRPKMGADTQFTTAATTFSWGPWSQITGEVMYVCLASLAPVSSIFAPWTIVARYEIANTYLCVIKKVATSTTESTAFNMASSTTGWATRFSVAACDPTGEKFIKYNRYTGGNSPPYTHAFDFSDVPDPTVSLLFVAKANSVLQFQPGPQIPKTTVNRIWSGPYKGGSYMAGLNHLAATGIVDGSVTDVSQIAQWTAAGSTGTQPCLAICIGLQGSNLPVEESLIVDALLPDGVSSIGTFNNVKLTVTGTSFFYPSAYQDPEVSGGTIGVGHYAGFMMDIGVGWQHIEPVGGPFSTVQPSYTYFVNAGGRVIKFKFQDSNYSDNAGGFNVTITPI